MPRKRKVASISFLTEEDYREAVEKAHQRGNTLSRQVQQYFKKLQPIKR